MRLRKRAALSAAAVGLAAALLIQGTAWAPRVKGLPGYVGPCTMVVGGSPKQGVFVGDISVLEYEARGEGLVAHLSITGSCRVGTDAAGVTDAPADTPVAIEKASCKLLQLRLGEASVKDITIDLSGASLDSTAERGDRFLRDKVLLCAIAVTAKHGPARLQAKLLNLFFKE